MDLGEGAAPPGKAHWKHLLSHARCWVECHTQGVYATRHAPWKHVECRLQRCTIVSLDVIIVVVSISIYI